ncbi:plasmid partitioning protein RepB [Ensifer sp. P24N7]|uniref:plasmid partitioning protein RepB n=1 Tax=Sinorhizobium sp. P24N7 TaxID=3348358 RepID=UPI0035F49EF9
MARKNPFASIMTEAPAGEREPLPEFRMTGASKSILSSIDELAAQADKVRAGQTVVELEPELIDGSFVSDRLEEDENEFNELLEAIRDRGQDTPILVRPHPRLGGRYMVVYGHRRLRVAKALGRKVFAVVKEMRDEDHVVAQGQENSARANLSFIERAVFAHTLSQLHYDNDNAVVMRALSTDRATLSKMLSVAAIPRDILDAIGAAKTIGRDRWYELKTLLEKPAHLDTATRLVGETGFNEGSAEERFNRLVDHLKRSAKAAKVASPKSVQKWASEDKRIAASMSTDGRNFTLALKSKDAVDFGKFVSDNLADLYTAFRNKRESQGE